MLPRPVLLLSLLALVLAWPGAPGIPGRSASASPGEATAAANALHDEDPDAPFLTTRGASGIDRSGGSDATTGLTRLLAAGAGRTVYLLPGVYVVGEVPVTHPVHIVLLPGATLKALPPPAGGHRGLLHFLQGARGSTLSGGGIIDGDRSALVDAYLATPRAKQPGTYVQQFEWNCVMSEGVDDLRIEGITLQNCMAHAIVHRAGDRLVLRDLVVHASTKVMNVQGGGAARPGQSFCCDNGHQPADGVTIENVHADTIGNQVVDTAGRVRPIPIWQYAFEIRDLSHFVIRGLTLDGYHPLKLDADGAAIGDPQGGGVVAERMFSGFVDGIAASGFDVVAGPLPASWGVFFDGLYDSQVTHLTIRGAYWPLEIDGAQRSTVSDFTLDGLWNVAPVPGSAQSACLRVKGNAILPGVTALSSAFDHWAMMPARNLVIANGSGTRCTVGAQIMTGNTDYSHLSFDGNAATGVLFWMTELHQETYPALVPPDLSDVSLSAIEASDNGQAGIEWNEGSRFSLDGIRANNNGQDIQGPFASGLTFASPAVKDRIALANWVASDTQTLARPKAVSFVPGATNEANRFKAAITSGESLAIGEHIVIRNGTGTADIDAKIMDITNDTYTLQTKAPTSFSDAGNLTALKGTVSVAAGGNVLRGSGTAFATAIRGPVYVRAAGQYLRIGKVLSDTTALLDTAAGSAITGAAGQLVQCDLAGVSSQRYGVYVPEGDTVRNLALGPWGTFQADDVAVGTFLAGAIGSLVDGQEFLYESGPVDLTGQTTQVLPTIAAAEAGSLVPEAYRLQVLAPVAGPGVTGLRLFADRRDPHTALFSTTGLAANAAARGLVNAAAWPTAGHVTFDLQTIGGAPSAGRVRVGVLLRKGALSAYPPVP